MSSLLEARHRPIRLGLVHAACPDPSDARGQPVVLRLVERLADSGDMTPKQLLKRSQANTKTKLQISLRPYCPSQCLSRSTFDYIRDMGRPSGLHVRTVHKRFAPENIVASAGPVRSGDWT